MFRNTISCRSSAVCFQRPLHPDNTPSLAGLNLFPTNSCVRNFTTLEREESSLRELIIDQRDGSVRSSSCHSSLLTWVGYPGCQVKKKRTNKPPWWHSCNISTPASQWEESPRSYPEMCNEIILLLWVVRRERFPEICPLTSTYKQ